MTNENEQSPALRCGDGFGGERYAGGEEPKRGDVIRYAEEEICMHREARESWIVTSLYGDMVRAKCDDAPAWRQAFYTAKMRLISRRPNDKISNAPSSAEPKV